MKITPGHDFNDFEVGKRAGIKPGDMLNMFDAEAKVVQTSDRLVPEKYLGLDRFVVREMIVADMKAAGFLVPHVTKNKDGEEVEADFEPRTIATPFGDRGGVVIEPWLTDQWYVDAETLAKAPMEAVRSGAIEIVPKTWEKTFFNWMENIQPWCVSRQLWWGHRIPAWYGPNLDDPSVRKAFVAENIEALSPQLMEYYGKAWSEGEAMVVQVVATKAEAQRRSSEATAKSFFVWQDEDVLDTWFSSALWPFATLGWPDAAGGPSPEGEGLARPSLYQRHYPNDLLISGFDILFFWDARMAMQGMHFNQGQVPWKRLYLHGLVRAADGQKMSKSKGNVVDPLGLIDQYGADALRFFMAAMESQGRDVKMDERRVEGYRNFATKLWNAARFCQSNGIGASTAIEAPPATLAVNKWIIGEVVETLAELDKAMAELRFDAAANAIYHFVWDQFCDWYIELIKGNFDDETKTVAGWVLDQILVMLHPFMPFVTEELWGAMGDRAGYPLITAKWPEPGASVDDEAKAEIESIVEFVSKVRSLRTEYNVPPSAIVQFFEIGAGTRISEFLQQNRKSIQRMCRVLRVGQSFGWMTPGETELHPTESAQREVDVDTIRHEGGVQFSVSQATYSLLLADHIDIAAEKARLEKALAASQKEAKSLEGRLSNPSFVEKAKPEAVEKARADHAAHAAEAERLAAALARLG